MCRAQLACTNAGYQTKRNRTVDAAASAAPKVASRYLIQDDSPGPGAGVDAAARSSSLTSFGSTVATGLARAGAIASAGPAICAPTLEVAGATDGCASQAGAGLPFGS